jgi:hypothetical protein
MSSLKTLPTIFHKYFCHPVLLLFVYLFLAGLTLYVIDYCPKDDIEKFLMLFVPWALLLNALLILVGLVICRQEIGSFFKNIFGSIGEKRYYQGILLAALVIFAFVMASFVAPRSHRIYFDEDIYANIGQNIALAGKAGLCDYGEFVHGEYKTNWLSPNKEPNGWPFLISLVFQIFGTNELYAFLLSNLLLAGGVGLVFLITREITGAYFPSIMAAFIFAIIPHNLIWANTVAAEPAAAFFTLLSMLCLAIYLKTNQSRHLYLLAVVLPFSCQMRLESLLIVPLVFLALVLIRKENLFKKQLWGWAIIPAVFLTPQIIHLFAVSNQTWGADGAKFSGEFFRNNIMVNGPYYLNNEFFPALVTLLAAAGLFLSKYSGKWRAVVIFWFIAFWGIFLFFYAGSYRYGADVRFAVLSFAPLAILAGMGAGWIKNKLERPFPRRDVVIIMILVIVLAWIKFLPLIRLTGQEAWAARADHALTREFVKKIPEKSIVLTHIPTMLLLWQQSAINITAAKDEGLMRSLINTYDGNVYFHYNYWCETSSDEQSKICRQIKQKFDLEEIIADRSMGRLYGLYRIRIKEEGKK